MMNKLRKNIVVLGALAVLGCSLLFSAPAYALTREQNERACELIDQGYTPEEANEIVKKEFGIVVNPNPTLSEPSDNSKTEAPAETPKPAHVHSWMVDTSVDATCTQEGTITRVCTGCGAKNTEHTPKTEHSYELTEKVEANCQQIATETYTCSVCGDTYTLEGELGNHIYTRSADSVDATCEEAGVNVFVCAICGDTYTEDVPALGHDFNKVRQILEHPTCTKEGKKACVCHNCGALKEEMTIPAKGHVTVSGTLEESTFWHKGKGADYCLVCYQIVAEYALPRTNPLMFNLLMSGLAAAAVTAVVVVVVVSRKKKQK